MQTVRIVAVITLTLILLGLSSCGPKHKYMVKGLTLPPGSTNIGEYEADSTSIAAAGMPGGDYKSISVSFDNPNGWDAVAAHFDRCMANAGFTKMDSAYYEQAGLADLDYDELEYDAGMEMLKEMESGFRMYMKSNTGITVTVSDFSETVALAASKGKNFGLNQFMLSVMQSDDMKDVEI